MAGRRKKRRGLRGTSREHARELDRAVVRLDTASQKATDAIAQGDCSSAITALQRANQAFGEVRAHLEGVTPSARGEGTWALSQSDLAERRIRAAQRGLHSCIRKLPKGRR